MKRAPLADYRIVYFATHALVAGDVKGLGEPSLALSIPKQPTDLGDGLLTATEVAQLKLNADWVVLSACNTIATSLTSRGSQVRSLSRPPSSLHEPRKPSSIEKRPFLRGFCRYRHRTFRLCAH